ncbi:17856_t:CDS:2 [Racocetra persica]|uniref:17856_t:CDS:1 n=1 Tax=Racocetra persica TaxID=160502 RepID=A0ACA9PA07_9GLOM|nr:17856_t:CDS:2 [Racocetra persica]
MTQLPSEKGIYVPVTAVLVSPNTIVQVKTAKKNHHTTIFVQLAFEACQAQNLNKPQLGHLQKNNVSPHRYLRETRIEVPEESAVQAIMSRLVVGSQLDISLFVEKEKIKTTGFSRGKGTAGVRKRYNKKRGPRSHGSGFHNAIGSTGSGRDMNRVLKGKRMPGRMGNEKTSIKNMTVEKIDPERKIIFLRGGVPGPRKELYGSLSLTGFTALRNLVLDSNNLTSIDISGCPNLIELTLHNNNLTSLDFSHNSRLEEIYITRNNITADLRIFSHLVKLRVLNIAGEGCYHRSGDGRHNTFSGSLASLRNCQFLEELFIVNQTLIQEGLEELPTNLKSKVGYPESRGNNGLRMQIDIITGKLKQNEIVVEEELEKLKGILEVMREERENHFNEIDPILARIKKIVDE